MSEQDITVDLSKELERLSSSLPPRYKCSGIIGQGGMGAVLKAFDQELGRDVAIKLLLFDAARNEELLHRFSREAKALASLNHANIVRLLSWGLTASGCPYHVLEYLEGQALSAVLIEKGKLRTAFIYSSFPQIFSALQHAHENGIVHRDLKPSNIIICKSVPASAVPLVKIIDFGIARLSDDQQELKLTQTNAVLGSPIYMSPEQCQSLVTNLSSDIYSLGCIMYECCTGKAPFSGENAMELMYKHVNADWEHLENMAVEPELKQLGKIIDSCLAKDPNARPKSMRAISNSFQEITRSQADSIKFQKPESNAALKNRIFYSAAFLLISILSILLFWQISKMSERNDEHVKSMLGKRDSHSKLLRQEKSLESDFARLKNQFEREGSLERKKEQVDLLVTRGRALSRTRRALQKRKEAIETIKEMLEYCKVMDEPELGEVDLLRNLAELQLESGQTELSLSNIDRAMAHLKTATHEASEDSVLLLDLKTHCYIIKHDYAACLENARKIRQLWNQLVDPAAYPASQRNAFLSVQKHDNKAQMILSTFHILAKQIPRNEKEKLEILMIYNEYAEMLLEREPELSKEVLESAQKLAGELSPDSSSQKLVQKTQELSLRFKSWQGSEK